MLRSDTFKPLPRVGAGTRSTRASEAGTRRSRAARGEAIEIEEKRFGYFPQRFLWRGKAHEIQAVERCWTKTGRNAQMCFRVRCREGVFDLTQHVASNVWTITAV